jgi:spermidine synthase
MCRDHLNPGGIVTQWVPLYETGSDTVRSQVATFFDIFPEGSVWANNTYNGGYDTVVFGQIGPTQIDVDEIQGRLDSEEYKRVRRSMDNVSFDSALSLFANYAAQRDGLNEWLQGAQINRDRNLRLQYLAGMELNKAMENSIYNQMARNGHFPENIFVGSGPFNRKLKHELEDKFSKLRHEQENKLSKAQL